MKTLQVRVKTYPNSRTRSYFPDKKFMDEVLRREGFALCVEDGIIFQELNPDSLYGIVTFDDALSRPSIRRKIGWYGQHIVQSIGRGRIRKKFVTGRFTSNFQIDVEFRGVLPERVDQLIARAIGQSFCVKVRLVQV